MAAGAFVASAARNKYTGTSTVEAPAVATRAARITLPVAIGSPIDGGKLVPVMVTVFPPESGPVAGATPVMTISACVPSMNVNGSTFEFAA